MNHDIALTLDLQSQSSKAIQFVLRIQNRSDVTLLLPAPSVTDLCFIVPSTKIVPGWFTNTMVSADWAGFTLASSDSKDFGLRVRPIESDPLDEDKHSEYGRWCTHLPRGELLVSYRLSVGEDYFCGDSHYRYKDLLREAEAARAVVWTGVANSETLTFAWGGA